MGDTEKLSTRLSEFMEQMSTRQRALEEQMAELSHSIKTGKGYSEKNIEGDESSAGKKGTSTSQQGGFMVPRYSKMEFPTYDGVGDPLGWLKRCEKFFGNQRTNEDDKVGLAAFHLLGEAQLWFDQVEEEEADLDWGRFKECCHVRFGPPMSNNPLGELANLKQTGTVEEYQSQFQSLLARISDLKPRQQVDLFTAGLVEELRIDIEMQQPGNLGVAMNMARTLERKQKASSKLSSRTNLNWPTSPNIGNNPTIPTTKSFNAKGGGQLVKPVGNSNKVGSSAPFIKRLTRTEMAERRAKGLCYNCDESYSLGHKCKRLFWIEVPDYEGEQDNDEVDNLEVSLHAISGTRNSSTMQLIAKVSGVTLLVLVDSGSTHNFLREGLTPKLGLKVWEKPGLQVCVANGERVPSMGICKSVQFLVADDSFQADFYTIPLEGFDVILGVKWLCTLGPILWDFNSLTMKFVVNGKEIIWQGQLLEVVPRLSLMQGQNSPTIVLDKLLVEFAQLFQEPSGLPPNRGCDHRIPLKPGSGPIVVRPYRYPHFQKDEIEKQCDQMLQQGLIQPSRSPFSSPVLLVKKHDGSWRFCVDYRELNACTVKDKYPIPVVDELLDELHGAKHFTKLDLRSGYFQIRMASTDVEKTAFRTHHGHFEFLVMPFGLTNAPSTFQSLMNDIFRPYLRKFVLVFFDDILIYSKTWAEHMHHIRQVCEILRDNMLFLKKSKCFFGESKVTYLGHVIHGDGVEVDHSKVKAVTDWPTPRTTKTLRGFLGLAGYYRKFIKNYGQVAAPLTSLLKKNAFNWTLEADVAFNKLKNSLLAAPVLKLPNFQEEFVIECDASGSGFGAVLQQKGHPIAFFSRKIAERHFKLAAYERELIGLAKAVTHWRPYLWGRHFLIRTDHFSLKYLLDQRLTTSPQQHWISKLMGFDFRVEYKAGKMNRAADALSRREEDLPHLMTVSFPQVEILDAVREETKTSPELLQLQQRITQGELGSDWAVQEGLIFFKGKLYLLPKSPLIPTIISAVHAMAHEGGLKTLHRLRQDFYWKGMKLATSEFVQNCLVCQRHKWQNLQPAGLLQPLPIPQQIWADISMDFVEGLPKVKGKSVLMVVVDRLSKYAHFLPLAHPFTAISVASLFFAEVFRLHGLPESIVSDRDKVFLSLFWKELFRQSGSKLAFSSAYHPQSDGQTKVVNRTNEMYLRCLSSDRPRQWVDWVPWAEYCYNTSYHTALGATPFQLVYGRNPPRLLSYVAGSTRIDAVDKALQNRDELLQNARDRLLQAQQQMKNTYDVGHRELNFKAGDWVWLRLQQYRQLTLTKQKHHKLLPKYFGPFKILNKIGTVAYQLELPVDSRIHDVFHVSLLKEYKGPQPAAIGDLPLVCDGKALPTPQAILRSRLNRGQQELLVQWAGCSQEDATWEPFEVLHAAYPEFELEDKLNPKEGSIDVDAFIGKQYQRRKAINK
ncbi:hypothetical protein GQ457_05G003480 [Hibiscus cannabinus]